MEGRRERGMEGGRQGEREGTAVDFPQLGPYNKCQDASVSHNISVAYS